MERNDDYTRSQQQPEPQGLQQDAGQPEPPEPPAWP